MSKAIQDQEPTMQTVRKLEALLEAVEHVQVQETHLDVLLSRLLKVYRCVALCVDYDVYARDGSAACGSMHSNQVMH